MTISEIAVKRPVFAIVVSLVIVVFGAMAFMSLPLRELPDIDPPIVSVSTTYRGASAAVIENSITQIVEDQIAGIEGIETITSSSRDGRSSISIEFKLSRDIEAATNDVRNAVARVTGNLPEAADPPEIAKVDADADAIVWYSLSSNAMDLLELTDYAERYIVDPLSVVNGVARVIVGGGQRYAMRIWLDREELAARRLTVTDVERALRAENVELPAGRIESTERNFTVRVARGFRTAEDFSNLVLARGDDGHLVRLGEVAKVERGADNPFVEFRGNGEQQIGIGIVKQSTANTLDVVEAANAEVERMRANLPPGMSIDIRYDSSIYISAAIEQVYAALFEAMLLVVVVIYLFLGNVRAALIPAVTVPVCIVGAFILFAVTGITLNLITLLALILAIGLVVDDAIVVMENIQRRIDLGEPPLIGAARGARQVTFAVLSTTAVLIMVFVPIVFLEGNVGRLFSELGIAIASAVALSALIALSLSPAMCSKLLKKHEKEGRFAMKIDRASKALARTYSRLLTPFLERPRRVFYILAAVVAVIAVLFQVIPAELAPSEDRGNFIVVMNGPEGQSFAETSAQMKKVEAVMLDALHKGDVAAMIVRVPGFGSAEDYSTGISFAVLPPWDDRIKTADQIMAEISARLQGIPGARVAVFSRQGLVQRGSQAVQFVLGGTSYEELADWRDRIVARASENPNLMNLDSDLKETKPQLNVEIDHTRAADLGLSVQEIGSALETMLGSKKVTTYIDRGQEYDVIVQGKDDDRRTSGDLNNINVRSDRTGALIPLSNVVTVKEIAAPSQLNRFNRLRAVTISAINAPGYPLGDALDYLEEIARQELPATAHIDYKGQSRELKQASEALYVTFGLALLVVFLVLAAQFESFVHPLVIILTVPLAIGGALAGLYFAGSTLNLYSEIGIVMLIGLAAKNGILIVEFANQLRDAGRDILEAVHESCMIRLRPILMTNISTALAAVPLALSSGAGAASRFTIGIVIVSGVAVATAFSLFVVPMLYTLLAKYTRSPQAISKEMAAWEAANPHVTMTGRRHPAE